MSCVWIFSLEGIRSHSITSVCGCEYLDFETVLPIRTTASVILATAPKWHMFTLKWQSLPVALVTMTGRKEEVRWHGYRVTKSMKVGWMDGWTKYQTLTWESVYHFLFPTNSQHCFAFFVFFLFFYHDHSRSLTLTLSVYYCNHDDKGPSTLAKWPS